MPSVWPGGGENAPHRRATAPVAAHAPDRAGRLTVVTADAARITGLPGEPPSVLVANLPYNVATQLLVDWLTLEPWPPWYDSLVLMFQREVAERIVAPPGSKTYGRLSVLAGWRTQARILFDVAPSAFVVRVSSSNGL